MGYSAIDPTWAWEAYRPSPQSPWDLAKVGHLYRRAAFGATHAELEQRAAHGPDRLIDHLLAGGDAQDKFESQTQTLAKSIEQRQQRTAGTGLVALSHAPIRPIPRGKS